MRFVCGEKDWNHYACLVTATDFNFIATNVSDSTKTSRMKIQISGVSWSSQFLQFNKSENTCVFNKQNTTIVGQFSTRQFGTKIIKRTIWHQDNKSGQFGTKIIKVDNLAPGQFGTRTIWHRTIWHQDNLAPNIWYD